MKSAQTENTFARIWRLVESIPSGRVATYGQIAALLGMPRAARTVGWALHSLPADRTTPWHRVVGAGGHISLPEQGGKAVQRLLLRREGVAVNRKGQIDLDRFQWIPHQPV